MLVKQHYAVDVLGGALVYLASRWFLARLEITGVTADGWVARWQSESLRRIADV